MAHITRRSAVKAGAAAGLAASVPSTVLQTLAQTPAATPLATTFEVPAYNTEGLGRGDAGQLNILWWQAPTVLNPHLNGDAGAQFVLEPLLAYAPNSAIVPVLVQETPTVENGLLAPDFSEVTFRLIEGLLWSDGEPVTARDIQFTWQWITTPINTSTSFNQWNTIADVEIVDDVTARVTFKNPVVNWYDPFTNDLIGALLPAHAFGDDPTNPNDAFQTAPIGTGPYVVESFTPNDQGIYVINENYREPNKPYFGKILLKGGGDAVAAGRAVLQTGDFDWAWNIQADPETLASLEDGSKFGYLVQTTGVTREALYINFSDPDTEVDGQRSEKNTPHPILSDLAVRQAIALGVDRALIAGQLYGDETLVPSNNLTGIEFYDSPNTTWEFSSEKATQLLEEAGWVLDGNVRKKDGVELTLEILASVNTVRQKTQAILKQNLDSIGFHIEIPQVDSTVFFDSTAGNDQSLYKMYFDIGLWSSGPNTKIPVTWLGNWYAGPNGENISQQSNNWQGYNVQRWQNADYDAAFEALRVATSEEQAQQLLWQLNDLTIDDVAVIPLVLRPFYTAVSNRLEFRNQAFENPFTGYFWNIENWTIAEGESPR
ncbi:MAG: peptide ABC transporter substrate-binding protein [Thermomicrobiales bacterium]|nr:peptide ABC transporter substrate-binding protein [Thermomicrobiales bacterium]MCO5219206.1 peptide ABC transporter substrate-binding protein [Thermomicrobiales bacterium]MCO5228127.1 peptide ABC transporter substrate-binding protein [Thermomicrobiales bacterium]